MEEKTGFSFVSDQSNTSKELEIYDNDKNNN